MSEPITWRSVSAPNFGASAALLNSGGETLNQGITSLANLATGIADKQKGIEVSNAVAALGKAANDSERGAIFDAQAANLRDQGIDLKDLIAADQARHNTLNSDATLKSNLDMNASNLASNVLEQAGLTTKNLSEQKIYDHLDTVQKQADEEAALRIRVGDSSIATNAAQAAASAASANNSNDAISERGLARLEKTKLDEDTTLLLKLSQDPKYANADGTANMGMLTKDLQAAGVPLKNIVAGMGGVDVLGRREELKATASLQAANTEKRDLKQYEQNLTDASKANSDAKTSQKAAAVANSHWYTSAAYDATNAAAIDSAHGAQATTSDGKMIRLDPSEISDVMVKSSIPATFGEYGSGGELKTDVFLENIKSAMANKVNLAEEKLKKVAKHK